MGSAEFNRRTIVRLYEAFGRCDGEAMAACYAPGAVFEDPAFGRLEDGDGPDMWRMLTSRAKDLEITLKDASAGASVGTAHWLADYTFAETGRTVHNDVRAEFRFAPSGLISEHRDRFSMWAWSRQALGPPGLVLGWTPIIRGAVQKKARAGLRAWQAERSGG